MDHSLLVACTPSEVNACPRTCAAVKRRRWRAARPCTSTLRCPPAATWRQALRATRRRPPKASWTTPSTWPSRHGMPRHAAPPSRLCLTVGNLEALCQATVSLGREATSCRFIQYRAPETGEAGALEGWHTCHACSRCLGRSRSWQPFYAMQHDLASLNSAMRPLLCGYQPDPDLL